MYLGVEPSYESIYLPDRDTSLQKTKGLLTMCPLFGGFTVQFVCNSIQQSRDRLCSRVDRSCNVAEQSHDMGYCSADSSPIWLTGVGSAVVLMVEGDPFLSYLTWLNTEGHWEREGGRKGGREGRR